MDCSSHVDFLESISSSERFQSLSDFSSIYGIGPATARQLYSRELRTIGDLEKYYDVPVCPDEIEGLEPNSRIIHRGKFPELSIKVGIALRHDFAQTIRRNEVEDIQKAVMQELAHIRTGCISTITGGLLLSMRGCMYFVLTGSVDVQVQAR